ncbi:hypothetical protein ElyMa_002282600 [Elysia marginata]|uniref:Uncharacterized protein n=1 Tax=Elysia marginata TaxID=1093978 RepID=A0AAV4G3B5_9GAST|nr:hypothetical protein ElyMa_002282600 [Elysia marginata]
MAACLFHIFIALPLLIFFADAGNGSFVFNTSETDKENPAFSNQILPATTTADLPNTEQRLKDVFTTAKLSIEDGQEYILIRNIFSRKSTELPKNITDSRRISPYTSESLSNTIGVFKKIQNEQFHTPEIPSDRDTVSTTSQDLSRVGIDAPNAVGDFSPSTDLPDIWKVLERNETKGLESAEGNIKTTGYDLFRAEVVGTICILLGIVILLVNIIAALLIERRRKLRNRSQSQAALMWSPPFSREACKSTLYSWGCDAIHMEKETSLPRSSCSSSLSTASGEIDLGFSGNVFDSSAKSQVHLSPALLMWFRGKGLDHASSLPEP